MNVSPLDPEVQLLQTAVAVGAVAEEEYEDALELIDQVIAINPDVPSAYRLKAVAYAMLGNEEEARDNVTKLLEKAPDCSIQLVRVFLPVPPHLLERHIDGLRKAGLPE